MESPPHGPHRLLRGRAGSQGGVFRETRCPRQPERRSPRRPRRPPRRGVSLHPTATSWGARAASKGDAGPGRQRRFEFFPVRDREGASSRYLMAIAMESGPPALQTARLKSPPVHFNHPFSWREHQQIFCSLEQSRRLAESACHFHRCAARI